MKDTFPPCPPSPFPSGDRFQDGGNGEGEKGAREGEPLCRETPAQFSHRAETVQSNFWFELVGRRIRLIGTFLISAEQPKGCKEETFLGRTLYSATKSHKAEKGGAAAGQSLMSVQAGDIFREGGVVGNAPVCSGEAPRVVIY